LRRRAEGYANDNGIAAIIAVYRFEAVQGFEAAMGQSADFSRCTFVKRHQELTPDDIWN